MATREELSSLPPAVLRAALETAEHRVRPQREKIRRKIDLLQKQLDELERGPVEKQRKDTASRPKHKKAKKRQRDLDCGTSDEGTRDGPGDTGGWYDREWPIAKVRKSDRGPQRGSPISPPCLECKKTGKNCEWDNKPGSRVRKCFPCHRSRRLCDLKDLKGPQATNRR